MHLENISLINFKNYSESSLRFNDQINCFVGENGAGKTNLLDAIHYLSVTKSFQNATDLQCIRHGQNFFALRGEFKKEDRGFLIKCQLKVGEKKIVRLNDNSYDRISEHIGQFPVVLITPNDTDIVRGASDIRRRFFDGVISLIDKDYLELLIRYNHALKQRNSLLKKSAEGNFIDTELLAPFNKIILDGGRKIFNQRKDFLDFMLPSIREHYGDISDHREHIEITYKTDLSRDHFEEDFLDSIKRDILTGRTSLGIHRDEYRFEIDGFSLKKFGSQGQQKSMIIALKLAQFDMLRNSNGFKPILLLDDIFDKLDEIRINKIMNLVAGHTFGQIFVTDTHPERIRQIFHSTDAEKNIYSIANGLAEQVKS